LSITKKNLSDTNSKKVGLSKKDSLLIVNNLFYFLANNSDKKINIHNFGSFSSKLTPKRIGRNPKTMENFEIKSRLKLAFEPSEIVKKNLN
tara:strand:+ start:211 stop:483 length:273 start_codon:yes stop_codon:yes gene_type:complete